MRVYTKLESLPKSVRTVVSVGNFDGVHIGHQRLIKAMVRRARELKMTPAIVTFDPHPSLFFNPGSGKLILTPLKAKLRVFKQLGVSLVIVLPFTKEIGLKSAREFIQQVLLDKLHVTEMYEGANFRFGYKAEAGVSELTEFGREFGFEVKIQSPVHFGGERVSSTRIRQLLREGNIGLASVLLSRTYETLDLALCQHSTSVK